MNAYVIGPGSWVRCVLAAPYSQIIPGSIYKVLSVHTMSHPCNGPHDHRCRQVAFLLAGITDPYCSQCFVPVRPGGPAFLTALLNNVRSSTPALKGPK